MKIREEIEELFDTMVSYIHNSNDKGITYEVLKEIYKNGYRDALDPIVNHLNTVYNHAPYIDENETDIKIGGTDYD